MVAAAVAAAKALLVVTFLPARPRTGDTGAPAAGAFQACRPQQVRDEQLRDRTADTTADFAGRIACQPLPGPGASRSRRPTAWQQSSFRVWNYDRCVTFRRFSRPQCGSVGRCLTRLVPLNVSLIAKPLREDVLDTVRLPGPDSAVGHSRRRVTLAHRQTVPTPLHVSRRAVKGGADGMPPWPRPR